ncbi:hypothetical protein CPB86DRAFT_708243, partial [Serendipita vermifera]
CKISPWISFFGSAILLVIVNSSLIIRVNALWARSTWVVLFSKVLFVLHILAHIGIISYNYAKAISIPNLPPFTGCFIISVFSQSWIIFVLSIAFETCMVILTVVRSCPGARERSLKMPLWTLLLKDGVLYYCCIIAAQLLALIASLVPVDINVSFPIILSYPLVVVTGVACNRLFIRLETLLQGGGEDMTGLTNVDSTVIFLGESGGNQTALMYSGRRRLRDPLSTDFSAI